MDNGEEKYPLSERYSGNHRESYGSLPRSKIPHRDASYSRPVANQYVDDDVEDDDEEEEGLGDEEDENDQNNGFAHTSEEVDDGDDEDDFDMDEDDKQNNTVKLDDVDLERHPKKRRLKNLVSNYELAPRMPASSSVTMAQKSFVGGRNSLTDWNEHETVVLLDAWGERFLQHGRKSLRSEEWQEVAEKVSEVSKIDRTDTQCRNRLDTLKKKYKKEKSKSTEMGGSTSKWVYFKKMDMLMSSPPNQGGLSCGLDSGEYVFMNPRAYLNRANGFDEMRDSPDNSESDDCEDDELDGLPPKKRMHGRNSDDGSSFRMLADSIHKFSEIYEKIESSKRHQMMELEKMRMDFLRDLELQKRQIMESAQAEIAKLGQGGDDEEYGASAKSASG
ncbi:trihelix transcription factor ASIL2-like [Cucurbita moschata]|uniref:Trihelix transcription factor ASIL2-like n=1 Tax=Cucurbita moschata TaxID=3662 RepID=A0A6J1GP75_CUCMO|nr:trihelix transcription factor ASIL2-like [Cucurbita moschata]XP_022953752.1 trihelix transcription factor ASIL2-like [Cucurbita moschata]XP_022953753.1 trihelix transcription factor ASIL2-like [Cucurbita moschata]